jgi:hypothetical protein
MLALDLLEGPGQARQVLGLAMPMPVSWTD